MRRSLLVLAFLAAAVWLPARPAAALPGIGELYAGLGIRTFGGLPGGSDATYAPSLEAGIDGVLKDFGVGLRLDAPRLDPGLSVEIRYSVLSIPFVRVVAGVIGGVQDGKGTRGWDGTYGAFGSARVSLGSPYLQAQVGLHHAYQPGWDPFATVCLGMSL